jgi:hypothetical protein
LKKIINILLLFVPFFLPGCENNPLADCFNSSGPITQVEREIGQFNSIQMNDNVSLYLRQSDTNRLVLEAGSNLMKRIVTSVDEDGVLEISNNNTCNWLRSYDKPVNIYLDFIRLDSLQYRSIGDLISLDTLRIDTLELNITEGAGEIKLILKTQKLFCNLHYGTATVKLSGFAGLCFTYSASFGLIDNRNLETKFQYVTSKSSNDMYVTASVELGATIENIGNIYYSGNPGNVSLIQDGTGQLIKLDK